MNKALGLTEDELNKLGQEYENDTWDSSSLGKVIMGRPRIADEEIRPITVRLPISQITALDSRAKQLGSTRSGAVREAVGEWLAQA